MRTDRRARVWFAAGFVIAAAAGVALSADIASGGPILASRAAILIRMAAWCGVWAVAVWCAFRLPTRVALGLVFAAAVAVRLAALSGPPTLSDDLYRYSWDGRVQAAGIDPYRYRPTSAQLTSLREDWLWPDAQGCADLHRSPPCTRLNRATERTIYPPLAEAWFATVYRIAGIDAHHKAWQVAGLVGDVGLIALLPLALRAWRRDPRWTALYALSPFPVIEIVNNGHVDGLAALLLVAALLVAARKRPGWAGALIGAAALVKLYPVVLVLALVALGVRHAARAAGAAAAVIAIGYLPHVLTVGPRVLGYLPGYLHEEGYTEGGRFLLAGHVALAAVAFAGVVAWVVARRPAPPRAAAALVGGLLLVTTPVQPWYAVTLLAVATVAATPAWTLVAAAGYPYFFAIILDVPHAQGIGRASYGLALLGLALQRALPGERRAPLEQQWVPVAELE